MKTNIYYCYIYLDKSKPGYYKFKDLIFDYEPFYVGKGKNKRAYIHLKYVKKRLNLGKSFNYHFYNKIKKLLINNIEPLILIFKDNLFEEEAYSLETQIIEKIGLKNLTNVQPGGKGGRNNKNFTGRHYSKETKILLSNKHKGELNPMHGEKYYRSEEGKKSFTQKMAGENSPLFNIPRKKETKTKISEKLKGFKWSKEEKKKRSIGMKKVWNERKKNNIVINHRHNIKGNIIKAINIKTSNEIIFISQNQCANFFNDNFRKIKKYIDSNIIFNDFLLFWSKNNLKNVTLDKENKDNIKLF